MAKATALCSKCEQTKKIIARGLCSACYQKARIRGVLADYGRARWRFGDALAHAKANETSCGCWPWPVVGPNGYPRAVNGFSRAYLATYTQEHGPVPDGLTLDHLCHSFSSDCSGGPACRHRRCVRPDHLEPITAAEQQARASRRNICSRGHRRTEENTYLYRLDGYVFRHCRKCGVENQRAYLKRKAVS
jgi:hypothetical protein